MKTRQDYPIDEFVDAQFMSFFACLFVVRLNFLVPGVKVVLPALLLVLVLVVFLVLFL